MDVGQAEAAALLFTEAIHDGPPTAALYAERAQALIRAGNFAAAAADATRAADLDPTMHRAYLRKARACINLERYGSARAAVLAGAAVAPGDLRFAELMEELDAKVVPGQRTELAAGAAAGACDSDREQLAKVAGDVHGWPRPAAHRRASSCV
nr:protein SGT1 homolog [Aegilops tauschii subsp. strangulata]